MQPYKWLLPSNNFVLLYSVIIDGIVTINSATVTLRWLKSRVTIACKWRGWSTLLWGWWTRILSLHWWRCKTLRCIALLLRRRPLNWLLGWKGPIALLRCSISLLRRSIPLLRRRAVALLLTLHPQYEQCYLQSNLYWAVPPPGQRLSDYWIQDDDCLIQVAQNTV